MRSVREVPADRLNVLEALWQWRENEARHQNRPPFKIVGDTALIEIAKLLPTDRAALHSVHDLSDNQIDRFGSQLLRAVQEGQRRPQPHPPEYDPRPDSALDRAVLAEVLTTLGSIPIAEYATPSTSELPAAVRKYVKAHDGMLLANHGALTLGGDVLSAYYKLETIEHFAKISLVARLLGRENLIARDEVDRLQALRNNYGIKAPAPICPDVTAVGDLLAGPDPVTCQIVQAPEGDGRSRLVPDPIVPGAPLPNATAAGPDGDEEIRLTYRELSALIEDAIRSLK